jgi:T5orf172 domain.
MGKSKKKSWIYFIGNKSRTSIKIGYSCNPKRRIKELQTANSEPLEILYLVKGNKAVETYYHNYFSEVYNQSGEWYNYDFVYKWILRDQKEKAIQREMGLIQ